MIEELAKKYPNDADFGREVRALLNPVKIKLRDQVCEVCGKPFKGTERISICPSCYV